MFVFLVENKKINHIGLKPDHGSSVGCSDLTLGFICRVQLLDCHTDPPNWKHRRKESGKIGYPAYSSFGAKDFRDVRNMEKLLSEVLELSKVTLYFVSISNFI